MNLTIHIPDDLAERLSAGGVDLERKVLEALVAQEYRAGRLTKPEVYAAFSFEVHVEFDGFLKAHGIYEPYAHADSEEERRVALDELARLGQEMGVGYEK